MYGSPRPTADVDHVQAVPRQGAITVQELAGPGSVLAKKHGLCIHYAPIADCPEDYATRLEGIFPGQFSKLRLLALESHDLVITKLSRNSDIDDADVRFLMEKGVLQPAVLEARYYSELRPYLADAIAARLDVTLRLWLEYFHH